MAHGSSGIQGVYSKEGSTGSANSITPVLQEHSFTEDLYLRSVIEENAFLSLSERSLIKIPPYTYCDSEPEEENDFPSMSFPRKLWHLVESKQFQSIGWYASGTSIVIHEELFKQEVLERKAPFKIFETGNMNSVIRQLNLYGFTKLWQTFQRSASLHDFLAEEKAASALRKVVQSSSLYFSQDKVYKYICSQLYKITKLYLISNVQKWWVYNINRKVENTFK